jgi:hypothetical protein
MELYLHSSSVPSWRGAQLSTGTTLPLPLSIQNLGRKPQGKRPLGIPRRGWECNVRVYLGEIGWEGVDWMHLAQGRDQWQGCCEHGNELSVP